MSPNDQENKTKKKRRDDGVKVKRSYYSFSKYYPGGGSSQKYRRVMTETPDEHKKIKIILSVFAIVVLVYLGCFSMSVALQISDAPTTEPTTSVSEATTQSVPQTTLPPSPTYEVTVEEPEREVNVTTTAVPVTSDTTDTADVTG